MRKCLMIFSILFAFLSVASCSIKETKETQKTTDPIEENYEESKLTYKGNEYKQYRGPYIKNFYPYIYFSYPDANTVVQLNDEGFCIDSRDVNCNFVCFPSKLLSYLFYIKDGVEIPEKIDNPEYINSICIRFEEQEFYVTDEKNISVLIDYFNSEDVISLGADCEIPFPETNIAIEANSDYYGGGFFLANDLAMNLKNKKLYLTNGNETLESPAKVNNIICNAIDKNSDSSLP